jgi:cell division protein FtsW (lipid II flippase)
MDAFSYVSVIMSVVIGLGLSHLLTGTAELFKARRRVTFYWVHLVWIALIFVGHIFLWWTMWNLRLIRHWNFFSFLSLLLAPVLLYVAAAFLIPKVAANSSINLREYFYENQVAFFIVNEAFMALMCILLCVSAVIKNARYHAVIALLFGLLFLLFVLRFGLRLGGI